jgi:tetratricopeptide (TPR) repeat protein
MPHASLGDRAAVLRTFEVCTSNLKKELGVEPGPETLATLEALIQPKSNLIGQSQVSIPTQLRVNHLPAPMDGLIGRIAEISQVIDLHGMADSLDNLGYVALHQGKDQLAVEYYQEALTLHQQLNNLQGIACYAALSGHSDTAIRLAGGAAFLRETISLPVLPNIETNLERMLSPAYHALGEEQAAALHAEGKLLPYEELIQQSIQF